MGVSFEQIVIEILGKTANGEAALKRFRSEVDQTSKSVDDNTGKLDKNAKSIDNLGTSASKTTPLLGGLGGASGMGLLIGAGVALSPVIATVGAGLTGLGLAAFGVVSPVLKAAQAAGGLQANMAKLDPEQQKLAKSLLGLGKQYDAFQAALQPQVLGIFGKGIQLAGHLMGDLQPIAKSTGIALEQVLGRIDAEFKSGTWQQFFNFMAQQAGPDVQLLGNLIIDLTKTLPPLLEDLQPVAVGLLKLADAALKAADGYATFIRVEAHRGDQQGTFGKQIIDFFKELSRTGTPAQIAATKAAQQAAMQQQSLNRRLVEAHTATADLIHPTAAATRGMLAASDAAKNYSQHLHWTTAEVTALNTAESNSLNTQLAYSNALITAANDAHTLRQDLKLSAGQVGLHTQAQRNSFSAANQYISDLENSAKQAVLSGKGASGAAKAIQNGLPILEQAAKHNHALWLEVQTLKQWLDKLRLEKAIHESVTVSGTGHWTVIRPGSIGLPGGTAGGPFAAGGRITAGTTSTADDVLIRASKNETVLSAAHSSMLAPLLARIGVPGYAAGGIIGSYGGDVAGLKPWSRTDLNASVSQITAGIASSMAHAFRNAVSAAASGGFADTGARSGNAALAQSFAASVLPRGWSFPALLSLWNQESGWNAYAVNASSGAYGIPQSLGHGHPYNLGDYKAQIMWGLQYIAGRYGSSQGAWAHEQAFNWYDRGGWLPPGPSLVYNGTGQPERVLPPGRGRGPVMVIEHLHVREPADVDLLARRLAFLDA